MRRQSDNEGLFDEVLILFYKHLCPLPHSLTYFCEGDEEKPCLQSKIHSWQTGNTLLQKLPSRQIQMPEKSAFTHSTVHDLFEGSKRRGNADASERGEKRRLGSKPHIGEQR